MAEQQIFSRKVIGALAIGIGVALVAGLGIFAGVFEEIESRTWDWRLKAIATNVAADPKIKIVIIDQSSLDHLAEHENIYWPWPRAIYSAVVEFARRGGAKALAFDILFTESSSYGVDDDRDFARSLVGSMPVVSSVALRRGVVATASDRLQEFLGRQQQLDQAFRWYRAPIQGEFQAATVPVGPLLDASYSFGNVSAEPDHDGVFRHHRPWASFNGELVPSLPVAIYAAVHPGDDLAWLEESLDNEGRLALRFQGPARSYETLPIDAVLTSLRQLDRGEKPMLDLSTFHDSLVFVGMDAPGLLDLRPTPLAEVYPGVEFNATVLDNLQRQMFIKKLSPTTASAVTAFLALGLSLLGAATASITTTLVLGAAAIGMIIALAFAAAAIGIWMPLAVPLVALVFSLVGILAFKYYLEGRQHRFIKNAFKYYVSGEVIDQIISDPEKLRLGGERKELTMFFSDIAGFTSLSEAMDPVKLGKFINRYLTAMSEVILARGGTLDKYEGDSIVAFWNAPLADVDHAQHAVEAAIECQNRLSVLMADFKQEFGVAPKMRIGIHTGIVTVGNFGSNERFNYTVVGDAANLASRLEGANKAFGTTILISDQTRQALKTKIPCRKVADIRVLGRSEVVTVFEPLATGDGEAFERVRKVFESSDLGAAITGFKAMTGDPVAAAYVRRLETEISNRPANWSPVWNLVEK